MTEERARPLTGNHVKYITGDATTQDSEVGQLVFSDPTYLHLGKENKSLDLEDFYVCFDTDIPAGATINRAALTVTGQASGTVTPLYATIKALAPGPWSAPSLAVTQDRARIEVSVIGPGLSVLGQSTTAGTGHSVLAVSANLDSAAQVVDITATNTLAAVWLTAKRDNVYGSNTSDTGIVWLEVWSATGSAGSYREDALLASSDNIAYNDLNTADTITAWAFSGANAITLSSGTNYVFKVRTVGLDGDQALTLRHKTENSGQSNNSIYFGSFDGFSLQTYPVRGSITSDTGYVAGQTTASVTVKATTANVAQNFGESTAPTYTPAADDPYTGLGPTIGLVNTSSSVAIDVASVPTDVLAGDHIYVEFANTTWVTSGNFSTEDLHQKWWKVLSTGASSITIEWDQTFSGSTGSVTPQAGSFYLARGTTASTGSVTGEVKRAVQDAANGAGFTGRVALALETIDTGTAADTVRTYHSEDRFLGSADYHGPTLWVNYTAAAPTGISVDAEMGLSSRIDAALALDLALDANLGLFPAARLDALIGLKPRIGASATISSAINGSAGLN